MKDSSLLQSRTNKPFGGFHTMQLKVVERNVLILFTLANAFSHFGVAQAQFVSNTTARNNVVSQPETVKAVSINVNILPLFGEMPRTKTQKVEDDNFLKSCDKIFPNRLEAAAFFAERAWQYLGEGELDTAVHRFNLCYLLQPDNVESYWGLGVVCYNRGQMPDAIRFMEKGLSVAPNNAGLLVDLATLHIQQFEKAQDTKEIQTAEGMITKAIGVDSTNANAYIKLAITRYYQEDYDKAWENLHKCRSIDFKAVDLTFLTQLMAKKPDPVGLFK